MEVNKRMLALVILVALALLIIIWPSGRGGSQELPQPGIDRISQEKADAETSQVERELILEDVHGVYSGIIKVDSLELVAKNLISRLPVAKARRDLEDQLEDGFPASFSLEEDGSWELDLGRAFSQYHISSIISTSADIITEEGLLNAKRSFYIPDLDDYLHLKLNGNLLDRLVGTFILEGENKHMKLSVIGSYKLDKKND